VVACGSTKIQNKALRGHVNIKACCCTHFAGAGAHPEVALYFYAFVVVGAFFTMNLFVGVVVDTFARLKLELEGSALLTRQQQQWCVVRGWQSTSCGEVLLSS
jgi:hypothetical protein